MCITAVNRIYSICKIDRLLIYSPNKTEKNIVRSQTKDIANINATRAYLTFKRARSILCPKYVCLLTVQDICSTNVLAAHELYSIVY